MTNAKLNIHQIRSEIRPAYAYTAKFHYNDHSKLRPHSLLSPLVSVQKCSFKCKWVLLMRSVTYFDYFQQVPLAELLSGLRYTISILQ